MGANITHAVGDTGNLGIGSPVGDRLVLAGQGRDGIALRLLADELDDFAEFAFGNHLAG